MNSVPALAVSCGSISMLGTNTMFQVAFAVL